MTTKAPLPVSPLNDLFALPDLAYISGSFDPADRLAHSDAVEIAGGKKKRLLLAKSANFKLMVSTQVPDSTR